MKKTLKDCPIHKHGANGLGCYCERNITVGESKLARYIYTKILPIYIPQTGKYKLAIWNCMDVKKSYSLWSVLCGIRITIRKKGSPILVIKKGEV